MIFGLLLGSVILMVLGPFTVFEHYIFGILALLMLLVTNLPKKMAYIMVIILCVFWMRKFRIIPANVPTSDRWKCVQMVCSQYPQPIYVVTNSGSHDHQGLGYAYLAEQMNCDLFAVTQWKEQRPKTMVVMNENTSFDVSGTDFYELNRFGERKLVTEVSCGSHLSATIFSK